VASLRNDGITGTGYAVPGGLVVASGDAEGAQLNRAFRILPERAQAGAPNIGELTRIDDTAARALFPPLAPGTSAIHLSGTGRVNGRIMRDALQQGGAGAAAGYDGPARSWLSRVTGPVASGRTVPGWTAS
jgi:D-amino-acid dehydrogenase